MPAKRVFQMMLVASAMLAVGVGTGPAETARALPVVQQPGPAGATIPYSDRLTDDAEQPVADGAYDFAFALYDAPEGGTALWSETQTGVPVQGGAFTAALGSVSPLPDGAKEGGLWLEVGVRGPGKAEFTLLSPRQVLAAPSAGPTGGPIGSRLVIRNDSGITERQPAVAYNSQQQEYLVVWEKDYTNGLKDICGQRVSKNGALAGLYAIIAPTGYDLRDPDVAYNSQTNEYLVVYAWGENGGIYGMRVSGATGQPIGSEITIATEASYSFSKPVVASAAESGGYLVVFERWQTSSTYGIRSVRVHNDGTVASTALDIDPLNNVTQPRYPDVAYNSARSEMLVVWQRLVGSDYDLSGQRVHMEAGGGYHVEGSMFSVVATTAQETNAAVAAIPQPAGTGQYLVVWESSEDNGNIRYKTVTGDGTPGIAQSLAATSWSEYSPAVAGGESNRQFLVVWFWVPSPTPPGWMQVQGRPLALDGTILDATKTIGGLQVYDPAIAAGPGGDFLVAFDDNEVFGTSNRGIYGWLWGNRVYLPLVLKNH